MWFPSPVQFRCSHITWRVIGKLRSRLLGHDDEGLSMLVVLGPSGLAGPKFEQYYDEAHRP